MQQPINIPQNAFNDFVCDGLLQDAFSGRCGYREFVPVFRLKVYRGLLTKGELVIVQVQLFKCVHCGTVHDLNKAVK